MKTFTFFIALVLSFLFLQCSKHTNSAQKQPAKSDSTSAVDSSSQTPAAPVHELTYEEREGQFLYTKYCNVCHGDAGKGDGFNAYNLNPKPQDFSDARYMNALSDEQIIQAITYGGSAINKSPLMPPWGGRLNKREIGYLAAYVQSFAK
ncbi:MAG: cytochrome c [Bacteroidota bacterium]|nr:cytochrome c [Bacteroidota bacterium]